MAVSASYIFVMRSTGSVKLPTYVSVGTLSLNTFLSYSLIFGYFGLPELGVQGAAIAAVISRALLTALLLGPDCAGGVCAEAAVAASTPIQASSSERFIDISEVS